MESDGTPYDVSQICLRDGGFPSREWHTTSLLRIIANVCASTPWQTPQLKPWGSQLKRYVAATTAAARLLERGVNIDRIVRQGLGPSLLGALLSTAVDAAVDLRRDFSVAMPSSARRLGEAVLRLAPDGPLQERTLFEAVTQSSEYEELRGRLAGWISSTPHLDELLGWKLPPLNNCAIDGMHRSATETWLLDRFLKTYLRDWTTGSLHAEYRWVIGERDSDLPEDQMALRTISKERLDAEIARRAVMGEAPASLEFAELQEEAIEHLRSGQYARAVLLFRGALFASPDAPRLRSNLAFCLIPLDLCEARTIFTGLLNEGFEPLLTHANLATIALLEGDVLAARSHIDAMATSNQQQQRAVLWCFPRNSDGGLDLIHTERPIEHIRAMATRADADQR